VDSAAGIGGLLQRSRLGLLLKIRPKHIFIEPEHQAATVDANGGVIIQASHPVIRSSTIHALILINGHKCNLPLAIIEIMQ
jgi:hypothetical protein